MSEINLDSLNKEQKQAVTHGEGPLLIVAGAGTGKTTVITQRVNWLIREKKLNPENILALTFTEKAAGEMEERVDRALPYGYVDLWVSTFHAFCERILKCHAIDVGLPNDFKLLNQTQSWLLIKKHLDKFELDYYRPMGNPTKFIHALIQHFSRCKDEEVYPEDYLKYAEELKLNLDTMESTGGKSRNRRQGIRDKGQEDNTPPPADAGDPSQEGNNAQEISRLNEIAAAYHTYQQLLLDSNALDFGDLINYTLKLFKTRLNILAKYREQFHYVLVDEFQDTNWAQYELIKLLAAPKNNITVVGDDDQSIYKFRGASVSNILNFKKDYPETQEIFLQANYRSPQNILDLSYKFIQLNNPERLEVKLNNYTPPPADTGDPSSPSAKAVRDRQEVTHPVSATPSHPSHAGITPTPSHHPSPAGVTPPLSPPNLGGEDRGGMLSKQLRAIGKTKGVIDHNFYNSLDDEVDKVVDTIINIKDKSKDVSWSDFAILVRANDSANDFIRELEVRQVPYQFLASKGLYFKPVVLDIINYLRLLDDYRESPALYRILNLPVLDIPSYQIVNLNYWAGRKQWSLFEVLRNISSIPNVREETVKQANRLLSWIDKHSKLAQDKPAWQVIINFLTDSGYLEYLNNLPPDVAKQNFNYLNQFYRKVRDFEKSSADNKAADFLDDLELELESGEAGSLVWDIEEGPEAVNIMTIHGAKGLEFGYVFIPNLVDKRFPTIERQEPIELPDELIKDILPQGNVHLQEERRLFYVAMTRAKQGLYLSGAYDYGGQRQKKPSQFLYELGLAGEVSTDNKKIKSKDKSIIVKQAVESGVNHGYKLPQQFSFSQLRSFQTCPLQYKFAYILRVPVKGKYTFSFGSSIHRTLQRFFELIKAKAEIKQADLFGKNTPPQPPSYQGGGRPHQSPPYQGGGTRGGRVKNIPTVDDLLRIYEESWIEDWYDSKSQQLAYKKKGKEALEKFYKDWQKEKVIPEHLEKGFKLQIADYTIRGVIDRVDRLENNSMEIIDYKTGASKDKIDSQTKEQLLIYQLASEQHLKTKASKLTYYYIEDGKKTSFIGTDKDLANVKKAIIETINKISASDFSPTPSPITCKHCDFNKICEFSQAK